MIKVKVGKERDHMLKGSVIALINEKDEVLLLLRHEKSRFAPRRWGFPGGKIETGETPRKAALRELKEETQLVATRPRKLPDVENIAVYTSRTFTGDLELDHEHTDAHWFDRRLLETSFDDELAPNVLEIYEAAMKPSKPTKKSRGKKNG